MKYAILALAALALAGCGSDSANQLSGAVGSVLCPTQTQGRTEGDAGCVKPAPAPQTDGRTK